MTISIPTTTKGNVTAYRHEQDGVKGYILYAAGQQSFITEEDADKLGRYFLFPSEDENPLDA